MEFLNDLLLLEDLTLTADCTYLDFTYVQNKNVKNITFYTDNCTNEYKEKLSYAFPDAQINIISSDWSLLTNLTNDSRSELGFIILTSYPKV